MSEQAKSTIGYIYVSTLIDSQLGFLLDLCTPVQFYFA